MATIKSKEEVFQDLKDIINGINLDITTADHSVVSDIFLDPVSTEINKLYKFLDYINRISSYTGLKSLLGLSEEDKIFMSEGFAIKSDGTPYTALEVDDIFSLDIENYAGNFNIVRNPGSKAVGDIRFYRRDNSPMTIPTGTVVSTSSPSLIQFETIESIVNQVPDYDSSKGLYYVTASVSALLVGPDGNVGKNKINTISVPIPSIAFTCSNPLDMTGGTDPESDLVLLERTRGGWAVSNINTKEGYANLMREKIYVQDVVVVGPTDSEMERGLPGSVDIWIAGTENLIEVTQEIIYRASQSEYLLSTPPVVSISSVIKNDGLVTIDSSEYSLVNDVGVNFLSVKAQDKIAFSAALEDGKTYTITYFYDKNIFDLQAVFDEDQNNVVDSDVLVKKGVKVLIDITASFTVFPGIISKESAAAEITSLLTAYFNGGTYNYNVYTPKGFGEDVVASEARNLILSKVRGIDRLETIGWIFEVRGGVDSSQIFIGYNEFARMGTLTSI